MCRPFVGSFICFGSGSGAVLARWSLSDPSLSVYCGCFRAFRTRVSRPPSSRRRRAGSGSSVAEESSESCGGTATWFWEETGSSSPTRRSEPSDYIIYINKSLTLSSGRGGSVGQTLRCWRSWNLEGEQTDWADVSALDSTERIVGKFVAGPLAQSVSSCLVSEREGSVQICVCCTHLYTPDETEPGVSSAP